MLGLAKNLSRLLTDSTLAISYRSAGIQGAFKVDSQLPVAKTRLLHARLKIEDGEEKLAACL